MGGGGGGGGGVYPLTPPPPPGCRVDQSETCPSHIYIKLRFHYSRVTGHLVDIIMKQILKNTAQNSLFFNNTVESYLLNSHVSFLMKLS